MSNISSVSGGESLESGERPSVSERRPSVTERKQSVAERKQKRKKSVHDKHGSVSNKRESLERRGSRKLSLVSDRKMSITAEEEEAESDWLEAEEPISELVSSHAQWLITCLCLKHALFSKQKRPLIIALIKGNGSLFTHHLKCL